jgi:release factor glutamine methyltransferase
MSAVAAGDLLAELADVVGSAREARWILEEVGGGAPPGTTRALDADQATAARTMAARRRAGEPLQYVVGHWPFRSLDLLVDRRVLIPRPETEQVVEVALGELAAAVAAAGGRPPVAVDLGTGSGAIALSLAVEGVATDDRLSVWATDVDPAALAVAAANLDRVRAEHRRPVAAVELVRGRWWSAVPAERTGAVDLVVANPPYVAEDEWPALPPEVRLEPRRALLAGPASDGTPGLAGVEAVLAGAARRLAPGGVAVVELAPHQATAAAGLARSLGFGRVRVAPDLTGRPRALVAGR